MADGDLIQRTDKPTDVLTPGYVAVELSISLREVQAQLASGEIAGGFKVGRMWRIRRKEFNAWLDAKASGA